MFMFSILVPHSLGDLRHHNMVGVKDKHVLCMSRRRKADNTDGTTTADGEKILHIHARVAGEVFNL